MRKSIELGILIISVLLALSIFAALAENQTLSKENNTTKSLNATNNTINMTAGNNSVTLNKTAENMTGNTTSNNPFAKVKGQIPKPPD